MGTISNMYADISVAETQSHNSAIQPQPSIVHAAEGCKKQADEMWSVMPAIMPGNCNGIALLSRVGNSGHSANNSSRNTDNTDNIDGIVMENRSCLATEYSSTNAMPTECSSTSAMPTECSSTSAIDPRCKTENQHTVDTKVDLLPICLANKSAIIDGGETRSAVDVRVAASLSKSGCVLPPRPEEDASVLVNVQALENSESIRDIKTRLKLDDGEIKKSTSMKNLGGKLFSNEKRSNSLPSLFCVPLFATTSAKTAGKKRAKVKAKHNNDNTEGTIEMSYDVISFTVPALSAMTPPPSYRSLVKHHMDDVPPLYEIVTGKSIHLGPENSEAVVKRNGATTRSSLSERFRMLPWSSRIFLAIIGITLLMGTIFIVIFQTVVHK
eukprot:gene11832-13058_t